MTVSKWVSHFFHSASETLGLCEGWKHSFGQVPKKLCLKCLHNDTKIQVMSGVTGERQNGIFLFRGKKHLRARRR